MPIHFKSYVPQCVRHYRALHPEIDNSPEIQSLNAAILFADISGFTQLTETLLTQGTVGIEQLTQILNGYFDALLTAIQHRGGDVIKFAGDALLVMWAETPATSLADQVQQAAACAADMQQQASHYQKKHNLDLALRIGVGSGVATVGHIGSWDCTRELLVVGPAVLSGIEAQHQAQPSEVVLSLEAWELIDEHVAGEQRQNYYRLIVPPKIAPCPSGSIQADIFESGLMAYLPQAIHARLAAGQTQWLAELRPVTVLFIQLAALTDEQVIDPVHHLIVSAQAILTHYEGSINKVSLDDKGISILAALGLPPQSHSDDAWRGVKVAQQIEIALREQHLNVAIGVTTGRAFCGEIGNMWRREYTLIGDVVNTAARLMQAARNQILCDKTTFSALQERLTFAPLPPLQLKGKRDKVAVYVPGSEKQHPATEVAETLLGRIQEQTLFAHWLHQAPLHPTPTVVLLEGEAGIGKSTLTQTWQTMTQEQGWQVLAGGADAIEQHSLYHVWRPVLMALWGLSRLTPGDVVKETLSTQAQQAGEWAVWWPLLNTIMGTDLTENETTTQLSGELRAENTIRLLVHVLQVASTQQPIALFLEDAHWFDSASWQLIEHVYQQVTPLLLVITTRPWSDTPPSFMQIPTHQQLRLGSLSLEEIQHLLQIRLGVQALPAEVVKVIYQQAEGHPFFSEELAYALRDAGYLRITPPACELAITTEEWARLQLPQNVEGVITSRVDRLAPSQQLLLKVASVIGRIFPYKALEATYPIATDKPHLQAHLGLLAQLDITPLQNEGQELIYWFRHNLTHQVVYRLMLTEQRQQLHQAVAHWYELNYTDLVPFYSLLAYHWQNANVPEKYLHYLSLAAQQALDSGAYREAQVFARQGRESAPSDKQKAGFAQQLGEACYGRGALNESQQHLEEAAAIYGYPVPPQQTLKPALGKQVKQQVCNRLGFGRSIRLNETERIHLMQVANVFERLGQIYYLHQDKMRGLYNALVILNLRERAGPSPQLSQAYANICLISGFMGLHWVAETYKKKACHLVTQFVDNQAAQAWVFQIIGLSELGAAQLLHAEHHLQAAIEIYHGLGDRRHENESLGLLSMALFSQGRWRDSKQCSQRSLALAQQREDLNLVCRAHITLAKVEVYQNQPAQAFAQVETHLALAQSQNRGLRLNLQAIGLLVLVRLQRWVEADQWWQELVSDGFNQGDSITAFEIEWFSACCEYHLSSPQSDLQQAQRACLNFKRFARRLPIGKPRWHLYQGCWHSQRGQKHQAQRHWQKARYWASYYQMAYEKQWATQWLSGNLLQPNGQWWQPTGGDPDALEP